MILTGQLNGSFYKIEAREKHGPHRQAGKCGCGNRHWKNSATNQEATKI